MARLVCITGPPCAGKSTYIKEHQSDNDIVFDYDNMAVAITNKSSHAPISTDQHNMIMSLREKWIRTAKRSNADTAWIICTKLTDYMRSLLGDDVEIINLELSEEECYDRLHADKNRPDKDMERHKIFKFFHGGETRMKIEIRSDNVKLSGYVNAVERRSAVLPQRVCRTAPGDFVEVIRSGTFGRALKNNPNITLRFNHERDIDAQCELREDNIGLHAEATISDPEIVNAARSHKLTGWSFGFTRPEAQWTGPDDEGIYTRSISALDLVEVSILTKRPAYPATSVEVRDGEAQEYEYRQLEEENEVEDLTTDLEPEKEAIKSTMDVKQAELDLLNLTKWEEK